MKKGCLFLLSLLIGLTFFYNYLFNGTQLEGKWWAAILLALGVCITISNLFGIILVIRQKIAASREQRAWKDGDYVALSGRIQALREPLIAPVSGEKAVIIEYDIKREVSSGDSTNSVSDVTGMIMTPCSVHSRKGSVRIVGFPLLAQHQPTTYDEDKHYQAMAEYLAASEFKERSKNPVKLIADLNEVLKDDDGEVKVDFLSSAASLIPEKDEGQADIQSRVDFIKQRLLEENYYMQETIIRHGDEVSVFGTYIKSKQAIDIGSGLKNLKHSIQHGELSTVLRKTMVRSIIATLIFAVLTGGGHWYVAKLIGFIPQ